MFGFDSLYIPFHDPDFRSSTKHYLDFMNHNPFPMSQHLLLIGFRDQRLTFIEAPRLPSTVFDDPVSGFNETQHSGFLHLVFMGFWS
jgi:hypothetical protein